MPASHYSFHHPGYTVDLFWVNFSLNSSIVMLLSHPIETIREARSNDGVSQPGQ